MIDIRNYISKWSLSMFGNHTAPPWHITVTASQFLLIAIEELDKGYDIDEDIAIHDSAIIEAGAVLKGPMIIGPDCFVAATAYLRGGVYLDRDCIVGPSCELKTTFMFAGSKAAHLNFIGDSLIGADVNIEAGAIIANYRNEMDDKQIKIQNGERIIDTGVEKFGALVGDGVRIGANSVIAPGALIEPGFKLPRLGLLDQHPKSLNNQLH